MIGFLGGTGPEGRGLAIRFALSGEPAIIGSRDKDRAEEVAQNMRDEYGIVDILGGHNLEVAEKAEILFITVPYSAQRELLESIKDVVRGKILVNTVVPLSFKDGSPYLLDTEYGSASIESQIILQDARIVSAFQTVSARDLVKVKEKMIGDVIVCSDDQDAKIEIMSKIENISAFRALDGGMLANSRYVESITALLLNLNLSYKTRSGIRVTGI